MYTPTTLKLKIKMKMNIIILKILQITKKFDK
jgi:hypothetical protein